MIDMIDFLIKQGDQVSTSMPECDNISTDGQEEEQ